MGQMANIKNVSELNLSILEQAKNNAYIKLNTIIQNRMYWLPESFKYLAFSDIYKKELEYDTSLIF